MIIFKKIQQLSRFKTILFESILLFRRGKPQREVNVCGLFMQSKIHACFHTSLKARGQIGQQECARRQSVRNQNNAI
jgi:hypothetical protein